jgi:GTP-binding protein
LLSVISAARPKVADYPFTTLTPHLGVVNVDYDTSFVCADIPGLIEGAADGAGLGHEFLRHVERCRLLLHLVDAAGTEGRDPCSDVDVIDAELAAHSPELAGREQIVVANKHDAISDGAIIETLREHVNRKSANALDRPRDMLVISAATGEGVDALIKTCAAKLAALPPVKVFTPDPEPVMPARTAAETEIVKEDGIWVVSGDWLQRMMRDVNFGDTESLNYFEQRLKTNGVYDKLEELGVAEGDTVSIYGLEFDYIK